MRRTTWLAVIAVLVIADGFLTWQAAGFECPLKCCREELREQRWKESQLYAEELDRLSDELLADRCRLPEAAAQLSQYIRAHDFDALVVLRSRLPGLSEEACLAVVLLRHASRGSLSQPGFSPSTLAALELEFEQQYGMRLPSNWRGEDSGQLR